MTSISAPSVRVEAKTIRDVEKSVPGSMSFSDFKSTMAILAFLLASGILVFALFQTARLGSSVAEMSASLEQMKQIEKRMDQRIDAYNAGVQNLFQKIDRKLETVEDNTPSGKELLALRDALKNFEMPSLPDPVLMQAPQEQPQLAQQIEPVVKSVKPSAPVKSSAASGPPTFRRVVRADGSVAYEKQ